MKKEYVVVRIDAAPDTAPYVIVSLSSKKDVREDNGQPSSPFGKTNVMGFSNMNDMAKELNKMMSLIVFGVQCYHGFLLRVELVVQVQNHKML